MDGAGRTCRDGREMQFDVLNSRRSHSLAKAMIESLIASAGALDVRRLEAEPRPDAYVVLYGLGGSDRVRFANRKRLIAFDAGYWERRGNNQKWRVSVGGFHCPSRIMAGASPGPARWQSSHLQFHAAKPHHGPILLVGNGPKSNVVGADGWSARKCEELRKAFPGQRILYRPKPRRPHEPGVKHDGIAGGLIDDALKNVSLVVCRHSNVAVDACRLGVPVVCDDGAAASIYPQRLEDWERQPSDATRLDFLHRLAWWQWTTAECRSGAFWDWIVGVLNGVP